MVEPIFVCFPRWMVCCQPGAPGSYCFAQGLLGTRALRPGRTNNTVDRFGEPGLGRPIHITGDTRAIQLFEPHC